MMVANFWDERMKWKDKFFYEFQNDQKATLHVRMEHGTHGTHGIHGKHGIHGSGRRGREGEREWAREGEGEGEGEGARNQDTEHADITNNHTKCTCIAPRKR